LEDLGEIHHLPIRTRPRKKFRLFRKSGEERQNRPGRWLAPLDIRKDRNSSVELHERLCYTLHMDHYQLNPHDQLQQVNIAVLDFADLDDLRRFVQSLSEGEESHLRR